jgi:hypothetical protein
MEAGREMELLCWRFIYFAGSQASFSSSPPSARKEVRLKTTLDWHDVWEPWGFQSIGRREFSELTKFLLCLQYLSIVAELE